MAKSFFDMDPFKQSLYETFLPFEVESMVEAELRANGVVVWGSRYTPKPRRRRPKTAEERELERQLINRMNERREHFRRLRDASGEDS